MLSDQDKVNLLMKFINDLCFEQAERENNYGRYDVRESLMAISNFQSLVNSTEYFSSSDLMAQIEIGVFNAKETTRNPGKENGGLGTYNGLLSKTKCYYEKLNEVIDIDEAVSDLDESDNVLLNSFKVIFGCIWFILLFFIFKK
jgi:hypothetical protein